MMTAEEWRTEKKKERLHPTLTLDSARHQGARHHITYAHPTRATTEGTTYTVRHSILVCPRRRRPYIQLNGGAILASYTITPSEEPTCREWAQAHAKPGYPAFAWPSGTN